MIDKINRSGLIDEDDSGYESELDPDLSDFKRNFKDRLTQTAKTRKSHQNIPKELRRIDSLARLLEGNSICAAVYYHQPSNTIWIANNKVHSNSAKENQQKNNMVWVFNLVSDEDLSIDIIVEKLAKIISLNFAQEKRFELSKLQGDEIDLDDFIKEKLNDMFCSKMNTKDWKNGAIEDLDCDKNIKYAYTELIKKISKITRDFLKLRDFLLDKHSRDPVTKGLLSAIKEKRFSILHVDSKDVHAEMRILADALASNPASQPYIGISKLCCDHCGLAMEAFGAKSRGIHGQRTKWQIPFFISSDFGNLKTYLGASGYALYQPMSPKKQKKALKYVSSKDANSINENARHGRYMNADSSGSDKEFGPNLSDEDQVEQANDLPLADVWQLRDITYFHKDEFDRLQKLELTMEEIVTLYKQDYDKFKSLGSKETFNLIRDIIYRGIDGDSKEVFEKLSDIYDDDLDLFSEIISDEDQAVVEHGIDEVRERYNAIAKNKLKYDSDGEAIDYYGIVISKLRKDNSYDFGYTSDNSENSCDSDESDCSRTFDSDEEDLFSDSDTSPQDTDSDVDLEDRFRRFNMR